MNVSTAPITSCKYLTFTLDGEFFGLEVVKVREVVEFANVIPVVHAPEFIRGVINLRGSVLPVMDLRLHFGMAATEKTADTCVIVVELVVAGTVILVGVLADSVQDVVDLTPERFESGPRIGTRANTEFISSWARRITTS